MNQFDKVKWCCQFTVRGCLFQTLNVTEFISQSQTFLLWILLTGLAIAVNWSN